MICLAYPSHPDLIAFVENLESEQREGANSFSLDAEVSVEGLRPATSLPDPAVDRYKSLDKKLLEALAQFKGFRIFSE